MSFTTEQIASLREVKTGNYPHYMKVKALALLSLAKGHKITDIADIFEVSRQSIYNWLKRFQSDGIELWRVQKGRGRKSAVDSAQVEEYLRQSPRNFGVLRTRWTLALLGKTVPCLKGYSTFGVQKVLRRLGYSYKRGQPQLNSPDPEYSKKNGVWRRR